MLTVPQTSPHLNRTVLQGTIKNLPKLRALHVIGCLRVTHVDVLSATEYAPLLQSLAFTVIETVSTIFFLIENRSIVGVFEVISVYGRAPANTIQVTHAVLYSWADIRIAALTFPMSTNVGAAPCSDGDASRPVLPGVS
jgi:hypothetical protein